MNKSELIKKWEGELVNIDDKFNEAHKSTDTRRCYNYAGRKGQLLSCLKELENLTIPVFSNNEVAVCVKAKHQIHAITGIYTFCPDCGNKI